MKTSHPRTSLHIFICLLVTLFGSSAITTNVQAFSPTYKAIAVGADHVCAVTYNGGVQCWGSNRWGQLGNGTNFATSSVPENVNNLSNGVTAIAAGWGHTCVIINTGGIKCWGLNDFGQLGDGTNTNSGIPVDVSGLTGGFIAITANHKHTCVLANDGGVKCWGLNINGQLGNGTNTDSNIPVAVMGLTGNVIAISAGYQHTCALTSQGSVMCWGGLLGNDYVTTSNVAVQVSALTNGVSAISAGANHTCALTSPGGVKCWGSNYYGELGNGTGLDSNTPVDVSGLTSGVLSLSPSGSFHACASTNGGLKCWGYNGMGQLGNGNSGGSVPLPVDVAELTSGISAISLGGYNSCILTASRGAKCWGWNSSGQLGDGTNNDSNVPVDVVGSGDLRPPIVFVHGWRGLIGPLRTGCSEITTPDEAKSYFSGVGDTLKTDGNYGNNKISYARLVSNLCYTPSLEDNVPNLMAAIDEALAANPGLSKVTLITHSMGGLVSRAYIEGPDYRDDVDALYTFGSPHLGAPQDALAFLLQGNAIGPICRVYQPAVCDFSTTGMLLFNLNHHKNNKVTYHVVSGDAPFFSRNTLGRIMDALIPGADDGIVPTLSGRASLLGTFDRGISDDVHGDIFGAHSYFVRDGDPSASIIYTECIKKVLVDGATNCGAVTSFAPVSQDVPSDFAQHTPVEYGTLPTGPDFTRSVSLESGPTLFASKWTNGILAFTLLDPDGKTVDPAFAAANLGIVTYSEDADGGTYYFPNITAGAWQMVLRPVHVPAEGATFSTFAAFDSSVVLSGSTDQNWYTPGASASITATLDGSPSSATLTATILRADGITVKLPLLSIGNGQYQASYPVPNVPGYVEVRLVATGTTATSIPFERGTLLAFQISPNTFVLNNAYTDTLSTYPTLSLYKYLNVTVGINAAVSGKVGLSADLLDGNGNLVAHGLTIQNVSAGTQVLSLQFAGEDIFASKHNGPYTLTHLLVTDQSGAVLVTQQADAVYTTGSYLYTDFAGVNSFTDVPVSYWSWSWIERLYAAGITSGCGTGKYCPDNTVTRAEMAVFLLRGKYGSAYKPPVVASTRFTDVSGSYWSAAWIEQLAADGITGGCGPNIYCPDAGVTRAEMAVFLLRGKHGSTYSPPAATGVFSDVPTTYWAAAWIEQLAAEGITSGCGTGTYCPDSPVTRAQMAVFLVRAFSLP